MAMSAQKRTRQQRTRIKSSAAPLTPMQTHRARVLLDLGLRQSDIISALREKHPQNVSAIFRDKFRSYDLESRVVEYLRNAALERDAIDPMTITLDSMGWPLPKEATREENAEA